VPVVGVLLLVEGALEIVLGLLNLVAGPAVLAMMKMAPPSSSGAPPPDELLGLMGGVYVILGLAVTAAGIVKIVAEIEALEYRGRTLGFVAFGTGLIAMMTCYYTPRRSRSASTGSSST
jgi:hypothetical protein